MKKPVALMTVRERIFFYHSFDYSNGQIGKLVKRSRERVRQILAEKGLKSNYGRKYE